MRKIDEAMKAVVEARILTEAEASCLKDFFDRTLVVAVPDQHIDAVRSLVKRDYKE